jgi:hypothetical protein
MKSRRMKWTRHTAFMEDMRNTYKMLIGNPEGTRSLGRSRCRLKIILKLISRKYRLDSSDSGQEPVAGSCDTPTCLLTSQNQRL